MRCFIARYLATFVLVAIMTNAGLAASPGPDTAGATLSYDVTADSCSGDQFTATWQFTADPDTPQRIESGDFLATFAAADGTSDPTTAAGTWWSRDFHFFAFWVANASDEPSGLNLSAVGVVFNSQLYGGTRISGSDQVTAGRYRFSASVSAEPTGSDTPPDTSTDSGDGTTTTTDSAADGETAP